MLLFQHISSTDGVRIFDEVQGVRQEAERLKKEGVNILIAVGHAGYHKDMQIAEQVPDIDLVVGGHTNTFLWNGNVDFLRGKPSSFLSYSAFLN